MKFYHTVQLPHDSKAVITCTSNDAWSSNWTDTTLASRLSLHTWLTHRPHRPRRTCVSSRSSKSSKSRTTLESRTALISNKASRTHWTGGSCASTVSNYSGDALISQLSSESRCTIVASKSCWAWLTSGSTWAGLPSYTSITWNTKRNLSYCKDSYGLLRNDLENNLTW